MISKDHRDKMYNCAPLLPPPGGDELRLALDSHRDADKRIEELEDERRFRMKFWGEVCWLLDLTTHATGDEIKDRIRQISTKGGE